MPALVDAAGPVRGLLFVDVRPDVGAFRILGRELVDVDQRLHQLILRQLPHIAGIRTERAHHVPAIIDQEQSEEPIFHRMQVAAQECAAALAPEDAAHLGMFGEIGLNALAEVG